MLAEGIRGDGVSRDQFSWDTGRRQEWCIEGGDLIQKPQRPWTSLSSSQDPALWCTLSLGPYPVGPLCSSLSCQGVGTGLCLGEQQT